MPFSNLITPIIIANGGTPPIPGEGGTFPDNLPGFISRVQLVDLSSVTPPSFPLLGELWVDVSAAALEENDPILKIWNGSEWIISTLSGTNFGFTNLSDTPSEYSSGDLGKILRVSGSGIEFSRLTFIEATDTPTTYSGKSRQFLRVNASETGLDFSDGAGVPVSWNDITFDNSSILDLEDTPDTFVGQSLKSVRVTSSEDSLEFFDANESARNFVDLEDTPESLLTQAGNFLQVDATESSLQFVSVSQIAALATPIGDVKRLAFKIPATDFLYTDPRNRLLYYVPKGGSVGRIGSNSDVEKDDWFEFYEMLWGQSYSKFNSPKGPSAIADWGNFRPLYINSFLDKVIVNSGDTIPHGNIGGSRQILIPPASLPYHTHSAYSPPHTHTLNQTPHSHTYERRDGPVGRVSHQQRDLSGKLDPTYPRTGSELINISAAHAQSPVIVNPEGGGQPFNHMPPYISLSVVIFTGLTA